MPGHDHDKWERDKDERLEEAMSTELWWLSCSKFTVGVYVHPETRLIVDSAPIVRRFKGQQLRNLSLWMKKFGRASEPFRYERIR